MRLVRHMFAGFVCYPAWRAGLAISSLYCACMVAVSISAVTASADAPRIAAVLDAFDVADLTAKIATVAGIPFVFCRSSNARKGVKPEAAVFWSGLMACNRTCRLHTIVKQPCIHYTALQGAAMSH